jgi:predicted ATPase
MTATFPWPKTRFIGRAADLARLSSLFEARAPIVTLWGPPGIGKTRLAIEACRSCSFGFCDLSSARDGDDMRATVENVLSRVTTGVVVLDSFEHLTAFAADVAGWSAAAPRLTFLVTSRARLGVEGEITHEVTPLAEAAELFVDRAAAVSPSACAEVDRQLIADVVHRLDGIPLAVELAAARVDVLGVRGLSVRLDHQLDLLGRASLRRAIDTSFALLSRDEQRVFAQCAVFEGAFDLEAATAVIASDALDGLQSLRDRSLLRCLHVGGEVRFALFESIREYALERLGENVEVRRRHANHYLARPEIDANLAPAIAFVLGERRVEEAIAALVHVPPSRMSDRLLDLVASALEQRESAALRRARGRAWQLRGRLADARAELERALAESDGTDAADLMTDLGVLHHQLRELDVAEDYYTRALELRGGNDARCLGNLGAIQHDRRSFGAALELYGRALTAFQRAHEGAMEGIFLTNVAIALHEQGERDRAKTTYEGAVNRLVAVGDRRLEAIARTNLGILLHELGDLEGAHACHAAAVAALGDVVDRCAEGLCCGRLAMTAAALGRREEGRVAIERGTKLLADIDDPIAHGVFALFRAFVELVLDGNSGGARSRVDESAVVRELSDDARAAARLIEAMLERAPAAVLVVGPEAQWFTPPGGDVHDLKSRRLLQRLLWSLVERHREAPGDGLTLDALREAGWPGERALPEAAANRVHVALTELRRRGLRSCLVRQEAGAGEARYLIRPTLRVELSAS